MQILYPDGATPARGYTPSGREKTFYLRPDVSNASLDASEFREQLTTGPPEDLTFPTPWLPDPNAAAHYAVLSSFHAACRAAALKLIHAIELGLGLQSHTLTAPCLPDASELTLNWYPAAQRAALLHPSLRRI